MRKLIVWLVFSFFCIGQIVKATVHEGCIAKQSWQLTESDVVKIEGAIEMPKKAHELNRYSRYYAATTEGGVKYVQAVFRLDDVGERRILSFCDIPLIVDGGCAILKLKYNFDKQVVVQFGCNGKA